MLVRTNTTHVANCLSHVRGTVMKLVQTISIDAGDMLPPELATLRDQAYRVLPEQLDRGLRGISTTADSKREVGRLDGDRGYDDDQVLG